jgi:hypothetical protein
MLSNDFFSSVAEAPLFSAFLSLLAGSCACEGTQIALAKRAGRRIDEKIRGNRVK